MQKHSNYVDKLLVNYKRGTYFELLVKIFEFIKSNQDYFTSVLNVSGVNSVWDFFYGYSDRFYKNAIKDYLTLSDEIRMHFVFVNTGSVEIIKYWLKNGCTQSTHFMANLIIKSLPEDVQDLL